MTSMPSLCARRRYSGMTIAARGHDNPVTAATRRSGSRRPDPCGCSSARPHRPARSCGAGGRSWCAASARRSRMPGPTPPASSARWVSSRPRLRTRARSSSNSVGVRCTSSPSRRTMRPARSISSPSAWIDRLARRRRGTAQRRLQPGDELPRAERLGDVVVGARLQRAHLVVLVADRGQHHDRHLAPLADRAAHLRRRRRPGAAGRGSPRRAAAAWRPAAPGRPTPPAAPRTPPRASRP